MDDPSTGFWSVSHIWLSIITVLGVIVTFFTKRVIDELDSKADQKDVDRMSADMRVLVSNQTAQHAANTQRLDDIYRLLVGRNNQ